jgi:hypothetical protein
VKVLKVPGAESPGKKLHHRKIISLQTSPFECLRDRLVDVPSFASPSLRSDVRRDRFLLFPSSASGKLVLSLWMSADMNTVQQMTGLLLSILFIYFALFMIHEHDIFIEQA